jgi:hypothetical protein
MKTSQQLFEEHIRYFIDQPALWAGLFLPGAIMEYPYASSVQLGRYLAGMEEIIAGRKAFLDSLENPSFNQVRFYSPAVNGDAFAEYHLTGLVKATGLTYNQHYMGILQSENGKIRLLKEFYNPANITNAYVITDALAVGTKTH